MAPTQSEIEEFQSLERKAEALLAEIAASSQLAPRDSLYTLERIAARAAKIAYGTDSPEIVSDRMRHLIAWTDHLDDEAWCAQFQQTLRTRPLISPYGDTA
jgi:hypothetical protein